MHRTDAPGHAAGYYTEGDPGPPPTPATTAGADAMNAIQEEIIYVIEHAGIALDKPDNTQLLEAIEYWINLSKPIGAVIAYVGATAPTKWKLCDGSAISRVTYAALFSLMGEAFGAGDGATTFNLPNVQQRFPLGKASAGTGSVLGAVGGEIDHDHGVNITSSVPSAWGIGAAGAGYSAATDIHTHNVVGDTGTENPPFQVFNFIVRVEV